MAVRSNVKLASAIGLAAMLALPAWGEGEASGYITLRGARHRIKVPGAADTVTSFGAEGAVVFRPVGRYNIQIDASYDTLDYTPEGGTEEFDIDAFGGQAHLLWGRPSVYTVGGFVAYTEQDATISAPGGSAEDNYQVVGGGFEADIYGADRATFAFQGGFFVGEDDTNVYGASGQGRFFGTPFFSLEGQITYAGLEYLGVTSDQVAFGAVAEYQFPGTPLSLYAGAVHTVLEDVDSDVTSVRIGARFNLGARTLLERDRTGASMRGGRHILDAAAGLGR